MIENILIIDTETTGLEPTKGAKLIEIGALLYNVKHKQVIQTLSTLLTCRDNPVQDINNIDPLWTQCPKNELEAIKFLTQMASHSSFIVAHNAKFDKKFIDTVCAGAFQLSDMKWVCTKDDFNWPVKLFRNRLQDICEALGVPYVNAHRALADCTFLVDCFGKVHDLERRMKEALESASRLKMKRSNTYR